MPVGLYYWRLILSRWLMVSSLVIGSTLAAWLLSVMVLAERPSFDAAARLNIVPTSAELGFATRFVRGQTFDGGAVMVQTYGEYVYTRPVLAPVIEQFITREAERANLSVEAFERSAAAPTFFTPGQILSWLNYGEVTRLPLREDLMQSLIENTTIEMVEGTYLMRVSVTWDDPAAAAWLANALADAIVARAKSQSEASEQSLTTTLARNLDAKRAELAGLLNQSRRLKQRSGVVDVDTQKQGLMQELMAEESRLTSDRVALDSAIAEVNALRQQASGRMSTSQQAVEQALAIAAPKADGLRKGLAIREGRIRALRAQFGRVSGSEMTIKEIDDRIALVSKEVEELAQRVSFNLNENQTNAPKIEVIERATPPLVRSSPKVFFNSVIGFVAGAALAAIALLLLGPGRSLTNAMAAPATSADDGLDPDSSAPLSRPVTAGDDRAAPQVSENISIFRQRPARSAVEAASLTPPQAPASNPSPAPATATGQARHSGITMTEGATALARDAAMASPAMVTAAETLAAPQAGHAAPVAIAGMIPEPADGIQYDRSECRAATALLRDALLGAGLTSGETCVMVSVGGHRMARLLTQCALEVARGTGHRMPVIDATKARFDPAAVRRGSLVYAGAIDVECPHEKLAVLGQRVRYFIGVPASDAADPAWLSMTSDRWQQHIGGRPHFFIG